VPGEVSSPLTMSSPSPRPNNAPQYLLYIIDDQAYYKSDH
jgi:hypothetical protein